VLVDSVSSTPSIASKAASAGSVSVMEADQVLEALTQHDSAGSKARSPAGDSVTLVKIQAAAASLAGNDDPDKLTLLRILGKGASGVVYLGSWRGLQVAVKTMLFAPQAGNQQKPYGRAVTEAAVCTSVSHRNGA
jgi:hypothetical protein